jgi:hypothetical protein
MMLATRPVVSERAYDMVLVNEGEYHPARRMAV